MSECRIIKFPVRNKVNIEDYKKKIQEEADQKAKDLRIHQAILRYGTQHLENKPQPTLKVVENDKVESKPDNDDQSSK